TGPGGYADLLVDKASFDCTPHHYSLNISKIGYDLFNQEPGQLNEIAIQIWGDDSYEMDFMLDDILLTDLVKPNEIDLAINSEYVQGSRGSGELTFENQFAESHNFLITCNITAIYWKLTAIFQGKKFSFSQIEYQYINNSHIRRIESIKDDYDRPSFLPTVFYQNIFLNDWNITEISIDSEIMDCEIGIFNSTHKILTLPTSDNFSLITIDFNLENYITNLTCSSDSIVHNETIDIDVKVKDSETIVTLLIINPYNVCEFSTYLIIDSFGAGSLSNFEHNSSDPRGTYSVFCFYHQMDYFGIGTINYTIESIPTNISIESTNVIISYQQSLNLSVNYFDVENKLSISGASISYTWVFGEGFLEFNGSIYSTTINCINCSIGNYDLLLIASKEGYATTYLLITINIELPDIQAQIIAPDEAMIGETIQIAINVTTNESLPLQNIKTIYFINKNYFSTLMTNSSGFSSIYYKILQDYSFSFCNISAQIEINNQTFPLKSRSIKVNFNNIIKNVTINEINQLQPSNNTLIKVYSIRYPSLGTNWTAKIPANTEPLSIIIETPSTNLSCSLSESNKINWIREVTNPDLFDNDYIIIRYSAPLITLKEQFIRNSISIDLKILTQNIPLNNYLVSIKRSSEWQHYTNWELYMNDSKVSSQNDLFVTENTIRFKISTHADQSIIDIRLIGIKEQIIDISPTVIIFGISLVSLTFVLSFLIFKKRKDVSLEIDL
ncbi:MAG: hypothetical protein U9O98_03735, partial [Asgard group archaeon]|nr:hypothetical protein [Asgard group archaeon]